MGQRQDSRGYIRQIEFMFYHEVEIRRAVAEARIDSTTPDIRNASGLPDPTVNEVIRLLTPIRSVLIGGTDIEADGRVNLIGATEVKNPESWLEVIDRTYAWCRRQSGCQYEVARRRYSNEDYRKSCRELCISETLLRTTLERVRMYAALQAAQCNLICVD